MANGYDLGNKFLESIQDSCITGVEAINSWPRERGRWRHRRLTILSLMNRVDPYKPCLEYPLVKFTGTRMNANCPACGWEFSCEHAGPRPVILSQDGRTIPVQAALRIAHVRVRGGRHVRLFCAAVPGRQDHAFDKQYADLTGLMGHIREHHPKSDFVEEDDDSD